MTTQTYQDAALHLLQQAETELAAGDTRQASEKAWGAAAQAVKSISTDRRWPHDSHALLHQNVSRLVSESSDEQIEHLFAVATRLHVNFYENWLDEATVRRGLIAVQRFIDKLDALQ